MEVSQEIAYNTLMPETDIPEKYKELTPQQLNQQLSGFFRFIPVNDSTQFMESAGSAIEGALSGDLSPQAVASAYGQAVKDSSQHTIEDWNRRLSSELLTSNKVELEELLSTCSHLTLGGVEEVVERYSQDFVLGLHNQEQAPRLLLRLMDFDAPKSGGVFNPGSARIIEARLFRDRVQLFGTQEFLQDNRESSGRMRNGQPSYETEVLTRGRENLEKARQRIATWEELYIQKYKISPRKTSR